MAYSYIHVVQRVILIFVSAPGIWLQQGRKASVVRNGQVSKGLLILHTHFPSRGITHIFMLFNFLSKISPLSVYFFYQTLLLKSAKLQPHTVWIFVWCFQFLLGISSKRESIVKKLCMICVFACVRACVRALAHQQYKLFWIYRPIFRIFDSKEPRLSIFS